jgi:hypothetical protein
MQPSLDVKHMLFKPVEKERSVNCTIFRLDSYAVVMSASLRENKSISSIVSHLPQFHNLSASKISHNIASDGLP